MVTVPASGTKTPALGAVTVTIASPAVFSYTAHGLAAGDAVVFSTTGALPTGLVAGTTYYVIAAGLTANAFEVSATPGGSAVNTSGSQSGTHTLVSESTLYQSSAAATYVFEADLSAMAVGDQVVLAVYKTVLGGGAESILYQQAFVGAQAPPSSGSLGVAKVPPLAAVSGGAVASIPASTGLTNTGALQFTLSQVAGTPRAIPYSINRFA